MGKLLSCSNSGTRLQEDDVNIFIFLDKHQKMVYNIYIVTTSVGIVLPGGGFVATLSNYAGLHTGQFYSLPSSRLMICNRTCSSLVIIPSNKRLHSRQMYMFVCLSSSTTFGFTTLRCFTNIPLGRLHHIDQSFTGIEHLAGCLSKPLVFSLTAAMHFKANSIIAPSVKYHQLQYISPPPPAV